MLLPGADAATARLFAEGRRTAFSARAIEGLPDDTRCTASFGVAERLPGESVEALLERADASLYRAKRGGRDRTVVATCAPDAAAVVAA